MAKYCSKKPRTESTLIDILRFHRETFMVFTERLFHLDVIAPSPEDASRRPSTGAIGEGRKGLVDILTMERFGSDQLSRAVIVAPIPFILITSGTVPDVSCF